MRDDKQRLLDILEAIHKIEEKAKLGRERFDLDETIQVWFVFHLQIIGEASAKMSEAFKNANAEIPWNKMKAMRNILVHDYFAIDQDEVWAVIEKDLKTLKKLVQDLLR
ncbi:MAG: nucleotidyltransferase [Bacteriovoracaceae bacterium]|nr:nucleotidyltransferase [Bacteriovoracaceae bacterium]